jgi:outer membrane lipoprotein-sorting protein
VKLLRTLSTRTLLLLAVAVAALSGGGAAIAVAASGGSGPTPPPKPLAQALHDAISAPAPDGITARITFTNKLFPSGSLLGNVGSALMSGASGRLWATNDGRGRLELQSNAGDAQIVWNTKTVTVYDASSNTAYRATLPAHKADATPDTKPDTKTPPSLAEITSFLTDLGAHATISEAQPANVAGQEAYAVKLAPKHDGGLLGSLRLAWDAAQGIPLRVAIYAQGSSSPVLELTATEITYGSVPASDVEVAPPAGAKIVDVNAPSKSDATGGSAGSGAVTGLAAVQAAAGFPVTAPDTLVGLPRKDIRLVGGSTALAVYGQGLGAIVVVERKADPAATSKDAQGTLSSLPAVSLDGTTGHELATQLGTVLEWQRGSVDYVLAGSLPTAAAEAAARDLK